MSRKKTPKLTDLFEKTLKNRWRSAPFVLRFTQLAEYSGTVLVINSTLSYSKLHKWQGEDIMQHIVLKG